MPSYGIRTTVLLYSWWSVPWCGDMDSNAPASFLTRHHIGMTHLPGREYSANTSRMDLMTNGGA